MLNRLVALSVAVLTQLASGQGIEPHPGESAAAYLARVRSMAYSGLRGADDTHESEASPPARSSRAGTVSVAQLRHRVPKAAKQAYQRASNLSQRGDAEGALKELERAVELDPDWAEARNDLGLQFVWRAQYGEAEIEFQRAVELAPESPVAHMNLALVELQLGDRAESERNLRRVIQLAPGDLKARLLLDRIRDAGKEAQ